MNKLKNKLKTSKIWILFAMVVTLIFLVNGTPFVFGDGYGYYHAAKNFSEKTNPTTENKPVYYPYSGHAVSYFNDKYVTVYSFGQSFLWLPFLEVSDVLDNNVNPESDYYINFNGHSFYDGFFILLASFIYSGIGFYLVYKTLLKLGFSKAKSFISPVLVYLSNFAITFISESPAYSHAYEIMAYSAILYILISVLKENKSDKWLYSLGLICGLLVLIRPTDIALVLPVLLIFFVKKQYKSVFKVISAAIPVALIFLIYNNLSYGSPLANGYDAIWNEAFTLKSFNLLNLLFSDIRGLFIWSPLLLLSVFGLGMYLKKESFMPKFKMYETFIVTVLPLVLFCIVYSFWGNWWAGESAGQRFFLVLTPLFAIGMAKFLTLNIRNRYKYLLIAPLFLFSLLITLLLRITPVTTLNAQPYKSVPAAERYTPFQIIKYHTDLISHSNGLKDYLSKLKESYYGGRSLTLLLLGQSTPLVKVNEVSNYSVEILVIPDNLGRSYDLQIPFLYRRTNYIIRVKKDKPVKVELKCEADSCSVLNSNTDISLTIPEFVLTIERQGFRLNDELYIFEDSNYSLINLKLKQ